MAYDIFKFWAELAPNDKVHPRDRDVLDRVNHGFDLRCLPGCYGGPLRTAPVVLLYLSPGFAQEDLVQARTEKGKERAVERRRGRQPLPGPDDHEPAWRWWSRRTKLFGPWQQLQDKIAILNISGYHSKSFTHPSVLAALPSCRVTLDWAQSVLFPQAERGERVVVCMRSASYWGLEKKRRYGRSLFAPVVNRSGYMSKTGDDAAVRNAVIAAVKSALRKS